MRDVASIIKELKDLNIRISIDKENLAIEPLNGPLQDDLLAEIRAQKEGLMAYCRQNLQQQAYSTLKPAPAQDSYPLSSAQRRLWILSQFEESNRAYHITGAYLFEGDFQVEALQFAFNTLIERHESLRTVFRENEQQQIRQYILPANGAGQAIQLVDLQQESDPAQAVKARVEEQATQPFNLEQGPLLRATLYQPARATWVFSYVMHHIISDGWSIGILIKELLQLYNAFIKKVPHPLKPLSIQYKDYAVWQQDQLLNNQLQKHKDYWLQQLGESIPQLDLTGDRPRPAVRTHHGAATHFHIPAKAANALRQVAVGQGATIFMSLLAAVKALLYRYSGQDDIAIGTSIASREHSIVEDQIGFYVNTLALRTRFEGRDSYKQLLEKVRQTTLHAYEHQVYPFDELVEDLSLQRDRSRHPLFDVMVVMKNMVTMHQPTPAQSSTKKSAGGLVVNDYETGERVFSKFDLSFFFAEESDGISLRLVYNKDIFDAATAQRLATHLAQLIEAMTQQPDLPVGELDYLTASEKDSLLRAGNFGHTAQLPEQTIVDLFDEQVAATPDSRALIFAQQSFSYSELQEQANRLAGWLITNAGVKPGDKVGILLDRSAWSVMALLGVLKAGAAYTFIETDQPKARKQFIIRDTAASALITQTEYVFELDYYTGPVFAIDIQLEGALSETLPSSCAPQPDSLAYITYTSGSTGQPKGVMITHSAVVDYYEGLCARVPVKAAKHFGLVSTLAADLGNTVIYGALLSGAALHIFPEADTLDAGKIAAAHLDCLKIVPSHWKALTAGGIIPLPAQSLVFGGEQLSNDILIEIAKQDQPCTVFNHYGPTETTIGKLLHEVAPETWLAKVPLGTPFGNNAVCILDPYDRLCPIGVGGEICISGAGLATGYLNLPALTGEKFVPHPLISGQLMYRTGDRGRWLSDGVIEFLGRKDEQMKVRGYRVEPGEIETALKKIHAIEQAVVMLRANARKETSLVAYIVARQSLNRVEIQQELSRSLPPYMLPDQYIQLPQLPLTANGKIARDQLPDTGGLEIATATPYAAPKTPLEEQLVTIWQEVLGRPKIGVHDNFFDLGGHSIKAVQLISRMNAVFQVRINIQSLFEEGTVENIAEQIRFISSQHNKSRGELKEIEL